MATYNLPITNNVDPRYNKLTVRQMVWAPNQARTLEIDHECKYDDVNALQLGDVITYTDPDLGLVFYGKIIERTKNLQKGEGITYKCADNYRIFTKTAAVVNPGNDPTKATSVIAIPQSTTVSAAIHKILDPVQTLFSSSYSINAGIGALTCPGMDKAGQSIDTWLEDILKNTQGLAYIKPVNLTTQQFVVDDFFGAQDVVLTLGSYAVINPATGSLVLAAGSTGETLNGKYAKLCWEGAGVFKRYRNQVLPTTYPTVPVGNPFPDVGIYKFYFPNNQKPIKRFINDSGECDSGITAVIDIGGLHSITFTNPPIYKDSGGWYVSLALAAKAYTLNGLQGPNGSLLVTGRFDYTLYEGGFQICATSSDPKLEGKLVEIHNEYFKYIDPGHYNLDHTSVMTTLVNAAFDRLNNIDFSGNLNIHVSITTGSPPVGSQLARLSLGSKITNFSTGGISPRVHQITYDFVNRSMILEVSNKPLRENMDTAKQLLREKTLRASGNWHQNKLTVGPNDANGCFAGFSVLDGDTSINDSVSGGTNDNTGFPDGFLGPTRCYVHGNCESTVPPVDGKCPSGTSETKNSCLAAKTLVWHCIDPVNHRCESAEALFSSGGKDTAGDCATACTGALATRYVCFDDGCKAVRTDDIWTGFQLFNDCCSNCPGEKAKGTDCLTGQVKNTLKCPDGQFQVGMLYDPQGKPMRPICVNGCPNGQIIAGFNTVGGQLVPICKSAASVVTGVVCNNDGTITVQRNW